MILRRINRKVPDSDYRKCIWFSHRGTQSYICMSFSHVTSLDMHFPYCSAVCWQYTPTSRVQPDAVRSRWVPAAEISVACRCVSVYGYLSARQISIMKQLTVVSSWQAWLCCDGWSSKRKEILWDLKFSRRWVSRLWSSGIWSRAVRYMGIHFSE
jgi:hypothetical protein